MEQQQSTIALPTLFELVLMTAKPTHPDRPHAKVTPKRATPQPVAGKALPQPQTRWQRTARYNWDKGGSRGGR